MHCISSLVLTPRRTTGRLYDVAAGGEAATGGGDIEANRSRGAAEVAGAPCVGPDASPEVDDEASGNAVLFKGGWLEYRLARFKPPLPLPPPPPPLPPPLAKGFKSNG